MKIMMKIFKYGSTPLKRLSQSNSVLQVTQNNYLMKINLKCNIFQNDKRCCRYKGHIIKQTSYFAKNKKKILK